MSVMQITEELAGIIDALKADNYDLKVVDVSSDRVTLSIDALDGACEDCLAPAPVFSQVVSGALGRRYAPEQISIAYPGQTV